MTVPDFAHVDEKSDRRSRLAGMVSANVGSGLMASYQIVLGIILLIIWQISSGRLVDSFIISDPVDIALRLWEWISTGSIWPHVWATVYATVLGFVIGAGLGIAAGLWLGLSPFLSRLVDPYIWAFNALPKVALAPLFILWFGLEIKSKVALAAVLVVFLVFVNTFSGVREVDQDLVDGLRIMRATRWQILTKLIMPSATSWIFVGLKAGVPYALIGAIIGEMIASSRGLGYLVQRAGSEFDAAGVFAALVIIAALAMIFNEVVNVVQRRLERWKIVSR